MLLHNSSNVYSRKVEYLYTLVYNALENLVTSNQSSSRLNKKKVDAEIQEFEEFDPQVQFLLLDDVIPTDVTNQKIDLPSPSQRDSLDINQQVPLSASRLSLGGAMSATVLDKSAVAAAATVGFLTSSDGTLSILNKQTESGEDGLFRMRGTASLIERNKRSRLNSFGTPSNDVNLSMNMEVDTYQPVESDQPIPMDDGDGIDAYGADNDNDGPGFQLADETDDFHSTQPNLNNDETQRKTSKPPAWELLDPHDAGATKGRPLRVGKSYELPPGLDQTPSDCVTGSRTKQKQHQAYQPPLKSKGHDPVHIATTTFKATMSRQARDDSSFDESMSGNQLRDFKKGLAYGNEFAYIAKATAKRKAAERRERRKVLQGNPVSVVPQRNDDEIMGLDDGAFDYGGDDDSYGGVDGDAAFNDGDDVQAIRNGKSTINSTYKILLFGCLNTSFTDEIDSNAATFEALCRAHIQEFRRGAEKYKAETNLIRRVSDWQNSLAPLLEEEEQRPEFDIHAYGKSVLKEIQQTSKKRQSNELKQDNAVTFQEVTKSKQKYDVCRLFLASLKLSEFGNVRFNAEEGVLMTPETLKIELLNEDFKLAMDSYIVPSAIRSD